MTLPFEETYIETNGIRLHAVEAGPKRGDLVILLHGFPETWRCWINQIEPLANAGFHVLAPDQRGYNLSDKPKGLSAYRLNNMVEDVVGLIKGFGREKAILAGHDWGGVVAWITAALYPDRVERLVVLNAPYPAVGLRAALLNPAQLLRSLYVLFFQLPVFPEAILRNNHWELLVQGMQVSSRPGAFREEDFDQYRQAWWQKDAMTCMLNWYRAFLRRPARTPRKPHISVPTLIMWGAQDIALSREMAQLSRELCENGKLIFFEDATHWLPRDEPQGVNHHLLDFLREKG